MTLHLVPALPEEPDRYACGRFEWERIVRRIRMPKPVKLLAFVLSTYADADGSRVRPGQDALAAVTDDTDRNVRRLLKVLKDDLRLIEQTSRGGGRGGSKRTTVYRLTLPTDLLDRVELLSPVDEPTDSPDAQMSGQTSPQPVDNPVSPDTQTSGQSPSPVDTTTNPPDIQMSPENDFHRTSNSVTEPLTGHPEPIDRTPGCPTTTHVPTTKDQPPPALPTQPPVAREPRNDHEPPPAEDVQPAPPPPRCDHGLVIRQRSDGSPACAFCRRTKPAPSPEDPPP